MARGLSSITPLLEHAGPFNEVPGAYTAAGALQALRECRVLVVGAGGLGCEILKNLALCGFTRIDVIDMDTVDVSNLNRQFLFRARDVGQSKAVTAARFVQRRLAAPALTVTPHFCRIQDKPAAFYRQFSLVVAGVDNVEARRWLNALLVGFVDAELNHLIPMVDGGTEGFRGQARVILPTLTSCFECSLDMLSPKVTYPVCTIANTPRLPEHCVAWASQLEWPRRFAAKFDADRAADVDQMHRMAHARASQFGIAGVTRALTLGVVKNIVPAIAATNAVVAAACCNEAFKLATSCNPVLNNYMMYSGDDSIFTYTYAHAKRADCPVCGSAVKRLRAQRWWTLAHFLHTLASDQEFSLRAPSVSTAARNLYMAHPPHLHALTKHNLPRRLADLVAVGEEMVISDRNLPIAVRAVIDAFDGPPSEPQDVSSLLKTSPL